MVYKSCFVDQIEYIHRDFFHYSRLQIKQLIKGIVNITTTKSHHRMYDTLFALYLVLITERKVRQANCRLMLLTDITIRRTSCPSQAVCMFKAVAVDLLRRNGDIDEALCLVENNIKSTDLEMNCTFNCARLLDLIHVLHDKFQISNDLSLLTVMMTFTQLGVTQLIDDKTCLARHMNKQLREYTNFCIIQNVLSYKTKGKSNNQSCKKMHS